VIVIIANTLVLALVGLIAAAGFVVIAQRRQRQLGLLAAIGGSPRDLRLVMVANGLLVGVVAASLGTVGGLIGWQLARPATEEAGGRRLGALELPWSLVAITAVLAVVVATLAAWWPALHVSRLPIMASLSGRPARPRPVHRSVLLALAVMAAGVVLVVLGIPDDGDANGIVLSLGLVAVVIGVVLIAPAAVRMLGAAARRMPFAPRLALRDLSRYQSRSAASLASITLGLGIAVSIVAVAAANVAPESEGNLGPNQLLVEPVDLRTTLDGEDTAVEAQQFDAQAATVIATLGDDATAVPLDVAVNVAADGAEPRPVTLGEPVPGERAVEVIAWPYVATPEVLAHFGIDPATIDPEVDVLIGEDRDVRLVDPAVPLDPDAPEPVLQVVDLPEYSAGPYALVTEAAIDRHGWEQVRVAWFAESPQRITSDDRDAARTAAEGAGLSITTRDDQDDLSAIRRWSTVGGVGLALAIVAMAVGMMRGEAARDVRTLTATGATSRTRRALTASTAGALATLGAVLGVGGAYVFLVAAYRSDLGQLSPLPVGDLLAVVVGLPVLATAAGWLLAGREPRGFARQALD
jgi:putative ABC transport system permease protein